MSDRKPEAVRKPGRIDALISILLSPYRAFKLLCFLIGFQVIASLILVAAGTFAFYRSTPDLSAWDFERTKAQAQAKVRERMENKSASHRWTPLREVSRDYLYSIVMSEDSGFFEHDGLNFDAIVSSLAENLRRKEAAFGGSTISQQVAKNLFLSGQKSLTRKLKEALLTVRLERRFSKNEILELYLNLAEFGPDLYGIDAASRHYFKKPPSEINALEGAFIAVMLPSPKRYHYAVFENRNLAPSKQKKIRRVLGDMLSLEFISEKQYRAYLRDSQSGRFLTAEP